MYTMRALFSGNRRRVDTDVPLVRRDFKRMLEHISELEKSLAKISELKEAYYKMEDYWSYRESQRQPEKLLQSLTGDKVTEH